MRLIRYLPSAWWRKRHCPREPESWKCSPHSDALLTGNGLWPKSHCTFHGGGTETGKEKVPKCPTMLGWHGCNKAVKQTLAGKQQTTTTIKLQKAYQDLTKKKGPSLSEDTGKNPRSCNSWIAPWAVFPSGTALSVRRCSQQSRNSYTMRAASEWSKSFLFRLHVI